jgi:Tfp pilus assembly protein PilO
MTGRDRMVIIGIVVLLLLGGSWILVVSPKRKEAAALEKKVGAANAALSTAESQAAGARTAQAQYNAAYAAMVSLGKAVPPGPEVPSLLYQIAKATDEKNVEFSSITTGGTAAAASATPASATTSFTALPFTFQFNGSFLDLFHLFEQIDASTVRTSSGVLRVNGRLLTVQSVRLAPLTSTAPSGSSSSQLLSVSVTATAYALPASQGLTDGATASAPAGTTPSSSSATTASSGTTSSATAPAVARVTP